MKEKILAAIKAKFPKVNLSKKRLDAIAAKIEGKVIDDETKIDAAIDDFNDFNPIADIAKNDDRIRDLESKVKPPATPQKDPVIETPVDDDTPAWAKALIESNKALNEKVGRLESKDQTQSMQQKLAANEKLKGIDQKLYAKWQLPEKDEDIEAFADEVASTYGHLVKEETFVPGQQRQAAPASGKVDADVVKFAQSKNEQAKKTA